MSFREEGWDDDSKRTGRTNVDWTSSDAGFGIRFTDIVIR